MKQFLTVLFFALLSPALVAQGAFLGVELDADTALQSATIQSVQDRSAASLMGLQAADVILAVGDSKVDSSAGLVALLGSRLPGEIVDLKIRRGQEEITLTGVLGRRPGPEPLALTYPDWGIPGGLHEHGFPDNFVPFSRILPPEQPGLELAPWLVPLADYDPMTVSPWVQPENLDWYEQFQLPLEIEIIPSPPVDLTEQAVKREVLLIYPESTSEERRQTLLEEAKAQYGDDVEVRFEGTATQIRIQTRSQPSPPKSEREF